MDRSAAAVATARYRAANKDILRERRKLSYAKEAVATRARLCSREGWPRLIMPRLRHRAKKAGLECSITAADIIVPEVCPVLGIPIIMGVSVQNVRAAPNSPSVDRFENSLGYIPGNVRVISLRANMLKSDASLEEMELILKYMRGEL